MESVEIRIPVGEAGTVSGLLHRPADAAALLVLAHGAGAGMRHTFLERMAAELGQRRVATLRYQFPYMEAGRRRTDAPAVAVAAVRAAVAVAEREAGDLALFAGGKSFGGRMSSHAASAGDLAPVRGLVFLGFPLHPAGRPGTERAAHLASVAVPMLFIQGTRDALAEMDLIRDAVSGLGERATLHVVDGGDHSFRVPRRSGRSDGDVLEGIAAVAATWMLGRADTRGQV